MKRTLDEMTGLRGAAAFLICLNHTLLLVPALYQSALSPFLMRCGMLGMSLFFCLSGFVIYYNYAERLQSSSGLEIIRFFIARFARIYPLYVIFLLGFTVFNLIRTQGPHLQANLTALPVFLSCMQSWFFGIINGFQVVHLQGSANISWSISTEFGLYCLFVPLAFLLKWKKTHVRVLLFTAGMVLLHVAYVQFCHASGVAEAMASLFSCTPEQTFFHLVNYSPLGRLPEFLAGCGAAMFFDLGMPQEGYPRMRRVLFAAAFLLVLDSCTWRFFSFPRSDFSLLSLAVVLVVFASVLGRSRILSSRVFLFMGNVSYSVYLLHIVFVLLLCYRGERTVSMLSTLAVFFPAVYLCAWLCFRFYEMPCRKKIRTFFNIAKA